MESNTNIAKISVSQEAKNQSSKNKKAFNYYRDEDNTMADMLYQRMEQRKQKQS